MASCGHRLSVAPMMDWTDRHCRFFHRLLAPDAVLYTEMVATGAVLFGDEERHLVFDPAEHPVVVQLGGSDRGQLAAAARIGAARGYDAINLNCGCPSDRVQQARFGACLMAEPRHVADLVAGMVEAVGGRVPVTVKCRIGIDDRDDFGFLADFVGTVAEAGCATFVVHARTAILKGLSPKENREIPPLRYPVVHRLKTAFPQLAIILNGGLATADDALRKGDGLDGVMLGRAAYQTPFVLAELAEAMFGTPLPDRRDIVERMLPYIAAQTARGTPLHAITRHMLGLFHGLPGARAWRRALGEGAARARGAGPALVEDALALVTPRGAQDAA